jgi:ABC-type Mn2+/Zn2+ transport system permease subunit
MVTITLASLMYGFLSPVIHARKLLFLSTASAHISLLAVVLSIPLSSIFPNGFLWAVLISSILIYSIGYLIYRGVEPNTATAVFVSLSASLSVVAMFFVLTRYSIESNLWGLFLGDPLLVSWKDLIYLGVVAIFTVLAVSLTYREQISIGLERDCVVISGINIKIHDFVFYTVLAISTVAMIRVVGFVLQHVLILLPSAIAVSLSKNSRDVLILSVFFSVLSAVLGLDLAVVLNQAPSGIIGLMMFGFYVLTKVKRNLV